MPEPAKTAPSHSAAAHSPATSSTHGRHVLLALGWYYPEIHRGIARFARSHGWHLTFDFEEPVPENWQGDGVLTSLGAKGNLWEQLQAFPGPIVDLAESRPEIPLPRVTADNRLIGEMAAEFFLARGYRHFAYVHRWDMGTSRARRDGFRDRLQQSGQTAAILCWQQERHQRPDTRQQRISWLMQRMQQLPQPIAVFGSRDLEAVEAIEACLQTGLAVPEQVAVLGVDNAEMICECTRIPLSSIDDNLERVGYDGALLLHQLMNGELVAPVHRKIPPVGLIERRSTDHLAIDHPQVAQALKIIHQEYARPITMSTLLERLPISRSGLEKAFREHYVRPPMEELRRIRFLQACKLLAETEDKIAAIAYATGFGTSHHLCRSFKSQFGITPKQYRQQHGHPAHHAINTGTAPD